jgi:hypothetical protein
MGTAFESCGQEDFVRNDQNFSLPGGRHEMDLAIHHPNSLRSITCCVGCDKGRSKDVSPKTRKL